MQNLLPGGVYPPLPTFFDADEELDLGTLQRHMQRLKDSGIAGFVVLGSNGEAVHLTNEERARVISAAREVAGDEETGIPLIAGCGEQSTRGTIAQCQRAANHGANLALVLPPSYYKGNMDKPALLAHYQAVAERSPIPVLIYNMPASTGGIDLDAELICTLAEHPNILGLKDSSGDITKLSFITANTPVTFRVFAGSAGFFFPALAIGAAGTIAALANLYPREICLLQTLFNTGHYVEARSLQTELIAINTAVTTRYGVAGLKAALEMIAGYGGKPRRPLQPLPSSERDKLAQLLRATELEENLEVVLEEE
ncbi:4-hydroxy-2-oxoglutarate aldolase [Thermosporothrix hazakensis]|jgi:4-hydroxy-2-oxoglutarate aldolase|uniref:4-hydroxy-2-oxoglutarate aldolase n=2 Tax=Thermosporothrix TaxID=768650 RepID=A0A326U3U9_THEHA|nr:dihydrodipicolinate synthase family protein [Thermosporothrix hazakensis]PZW25433.1 4-hydroxy-2-oxoglutarate aldolase [Thermosporothrix hazakensis]BBH90769.1 dihydrodipicolinate synthase family protein [Thermosporothrix sp. COM3]GCE48818.1 dihydrodipicolinate synthase family protein [Thermosporothrix hazakensis]